MSEAQSQPNDLLDADGNRLPCKEEAARLAARLDVQAAAAAAGMPLGNFVAAIQHLMDLG